MVGAFFISSSVASSSSSSPSDNSSDSSSSGSDASSFVKFSSFSKYYGKAYLELAKIYIKLNDLKAAKKSLKNLFNSSKTDNETKQEAKYLLAKIKFYESDFAGSLSDLANINKDLSNDLSNDAIELSIIINMGKRDSLSLVEFANAELKTEQLNFEDAEKEFKNLSKKENLFFLNNISRIKYAEILIAQNKYPVAIEILKELSEPKLWEEAKNQGMITMMQDGILKVLEGVTSIEEVLRVAEQK